MANPKFPLTKKISLTLFVNGEEIFSSFETYALIPMKKIAKKFVSDFEGMDKFKPKQISALEKIMCGIIDETAKLEKAHVAEFSNVKIETTFSKF